MATATARNAMPTRTASYALNNGPILDRGGIPKQEERQIPAGHHGVEGTGFRAQDEAVNQRFLDPEQAAAFLGGLNSRTVTRWAREGYLPAYPIGEGKRRLWRFLESDLEIWMLSRRTGQSPSDVEAARRTLGSAADAPIGGRFQ
jgi:hypothetical protein